MATLYVSKSGSDSNDGSSYALSKLTIQAAVNASLTGDTIIVGSGLYNEKISSVNGKSLTLSADGTVVMDGTALASNPFFSFTGILTVNIGPATTGGQWIFQNNVGTSLCYYSGTNAAAVNYTNCTFISNSNSYGVYFYSGTTSDSFTVTNCVFSGFTAGVYGLGAAAQITVNAYRCTFYNCTYGISSTNSTTGGVMGVLSLNIFSNCTTAWKQGSSSAITYLNDNQYYSITNWQISTNTYTTLAQVQAVGTNYDSRSAVADPQFADPANNIFYPKVASSVSPYVGAFPYSFTQGSANDSLGKWNIIPAAGHDNSGWYNPDGNVTKNGTTGNFELTSGTSGVLWSPVYDVGSIQTISKVSLSKAEIWGSNMIDTTKTDTKPNYQTIEVRASTSSFNQDDADIAWTEVKTEIAFTGMSGRYVQLRLTMRTDDVSA
ncbi:MAG: hypothetical protein WCW44_00440 [archaeon]|jgi:hypothetical protein